MLGLASNEGLGHAGDEARKDMRKIVLGGLCGALMGILLAHMGHSYLTWEFWAGLTLMVAYGLNISID